MNMEQVTELRSFMSDEPSQLEGVVALDSNWLIHRSYHTNQNLSVVIGGIPVITGDIYGFCRSVMDALRRRPSYAVVMCCDSPKNDRKEIYAGYKGTRDHGGVAYGKWVEAMRTVSMFPGVYLSQEPGKEADDIIFSLASDYSERGKNTIIFSSDNDLLQSLQFNNVERRSSFAKGADSHGPSYVRERYGVEPSRLAFFRAIIGDKSDNLDGYMRFPKKVAVQVVSEFNNPDEYIHAVNSGKYVPNNRWTKMLSDEPDLMIRNFKIMGLSKIPYRIFKMEATQEFVIKYRLNSVKRFVEDYTDGSVRKITLGD